jgi:hypothetical protein
MGLAAGPVVVDPATGIVTPDFLASEQLFYEQLA